MKYLKSFFSKKEKSKSEVLYKKINHQEFIDYDDNHSKDDYDGGEINRIKSFFKYKIFGKNTNYCVSIAKSNKLNDVSKTFFVIEKYADGWYIVHICKYRITQEIMEKLKGFAFGTHRGNRRPDHEGGKQDSKCPIENGNIFFFHNLIF